MHNAVRGRVVRVLVDRIGPDGIGLKLREGTWSEWMPPEELIASREHSAATTTRAAARSDFVNAFGRRADLRQDAKVEWIDVSYRKNHRVKLDNVYKAQYNQVDSLITRFAA